MTKGVINGWRLGVVMGRYVGLEGTYRSIVLVVGGESIHRAPRIASSCTAATF